MTDPHPHPAPSLPGPPIDDVEAFKKCLTLAGFDTMTARTRADGTVTVAVPDALADVAALPRLTHLDEGEAREIVVGAPIASGGMGLVCEATQVSLKRDVAVKLAVPRDDGSIADARELLFEARVMGLLSHPNIAPVYMLGGDARGNAMLVMKRVEGTPWSQRLRGPETGADLERQLSILVDVCRAVEFAHARTILHRDIKPENVMIGAFDEVYLLDWGLALCMDDDVARKHGIPAATNEKRIAGTPAYMAPEMVLPEGNLDRRTDVFLLGAVLHQIITGEPRWTAQDTFMKLHSIWKCEPYDYDESVPPEMRSLLWRAMAREPADRMQTVEELRLALLSFQKHEAARQLAQEANARRQQLVTMAAVNELDEEAERLYTEARFGLQQALAMWPEFPEANDALEESARAMTERAIIAERADAAERHLREVSAPSEDLKERVRDLRAREASKAADLERLREIERDQLRRVGRPARAVINTSFGAAWIAICFGSNAGGTSVTPWLYAWCLVFSTVIFATYLRRRALGKSNDYDRFGSLLLGGYGLVEAAVLWLCLRAGAPLWLALTLMQLLVVLCLAAVALGFDPRLLPMVALMALATAPIVFWPEHALVLSGLLGGGSFVTIGIVIGVISLREPTRKRRGARAD